MKLADLSSQFGIEQDQRTTSNALGETLVRLSDKPLSEPMFAPMPLNSP